MSRYERRLAQRVESQVLACIGCNDCLLACPVPESRLVTIGELNSAVNQALIAQKNVIDFVSACTQCGQCVPACPADLNRAEMVLFNKLKVEDSIPDHELSLQARNVAFPSGWTLDGLAQTLLSLELFKGASPLSMRRLLQKSTLRLLVAGEELCKSGEFYEKLSIVLSGSLDQTSIGPRGERLHLLMLGPGTFLGEVGVLGDCAEAFGAVARETSVVLEAPKVAVLRLMDQAPEFAHTLETLYGRHALWTYAREPGALGALPEAALGELMAGARLELLPSGKQLFRQGDTPTDLFLVRSGFLKATHADARGVRALTYFREGDVFAVLAVLYRETMHVYGVEAVGRAEVIRIPGASLWPVLSRYQGSDAALQHSALSAERLARARDVGVGPMNQAARTSTSELLVEQGIAKGREVLVIDQTVCTGCSNCIDACERRHGQSRLQLRGLQIGKYMFPAACRHCSDPACLLCSVNGIVRLPSGEIQIVEESCIGCGACATRCPYGNISMHPVDEPKKGVVFSILNFLAGSPAREHAIEEIDPKVQKVAVKCDLCAGYNDYACVTACPVGANFRIDPAKLAVIEPPAS
ncbi:MAG TPA: cyclic nucleotide-binding domain-containing protein [Polyangiaceae bacterium]|nr:cyclic nucleotide-binding domain-containing protein [Polyangiaceae bacterium]